MATTTTQGLQDFGVRSLVTHSIMAVALLGAVGAAFLVDGEVGRISFVALLNFTAGLWVSQSVHSAGNPEYRGVLDVVRRYVD
jgi:hypothetical protein